MSTRPEESSLGPTELIRPASPLHGAHRWSLGPIDIFALRWLIQGTWVFDTALDPAALKRGLARLLDAYPLLAGRIVRGRAIEHPSRGVPFSVRADADLAVEHFDSTGMDVRRFADRRRLGRIKRGRGPLMTVRLTRLRDGWVLAVCCSHACVDGNGFFSMIRNWGRATTGRSFDPPVFERPSIDWVEPRSRAEVARSAREAGWHRLSPLDGLRFLFALPRSLDRAFIARFSPEELRRCKQVLARESGCEHLSTNSAILAHVAHCVAALCGLDPQTRLAVSTVVDQRGRVTGLPNTFAGNAASLVATPDFSASLSSGEIAGCLHRRLAPMLIRPSAELEACARLMDEVAHHRLPFSAIPISRMLGRRPSLLYTNSFGRFPVYDVDFGSADSPVRPVRVIPHNLGDPVVLWPAPPSAGGLELYFGGALARAVRARGDADRWWSELSGFGGRARTT